MHEGLLLGVPHIDHQHHELLEILRKLDLSGESDFSDEVLNDTLSKFSAQIRHHFIAEENWMVELNVPDTIFKAHHAAHGAILEDLAQIHINAMYGKKLDLQEVIKIVANWVHQHLLEFDLALLPYVAAQNTQ